MDSEVFLDTAYAIALANAIDQFHERAVTVAKELRRQKTRLITTRAVLLEIGNALSGQRFRAAAVKLLDALEADPTVGIVTVTDGLYSQALTLYRTRPDKEWGLVDCLSFVVMQERQLTSALTADMHFQQAGFRVLLRE
ncbi:MAG: type II toxin-antitoxin system VapC family toxin [Caldilineaceae bacterium]|nr:type II toxin-antitoxin system VapC family toxin [Caldilineaceae bacterium]